ncbi:conserved hypothetical protein [Ricinus communis]|uniref:Uncharacterized protein n=1 Tax=Ricinus communis TaxID=3988 RepID=B9RMU1_RICCO|nr:conserved hypothetical protein [Ricinus communis]
MPYGGSRMWRNEYVFRNVSKPLSSKVRWLRDYADQVAYAFQGTAVVMGRSHGMGLVRSDSHVAGGGGLNRNANGPSMLECVWLWKHRGLGCYSRLKWLASDKEVSEGVNSNLVFICVVSA